jgi:hypothetical protein
MDLAIHSTVIESSPYAGPLSQTHEWVLKICSSTNKFRLYQYFMDVYVMFHFLFYSSRISLG